MNLWGLFGAASRQEGHRPKEWFWADYLHCHHTGDFVAYLLKAAQKTGDRNLIAYSLGTGNPGMGGDTVTMGIFDRGRQLFSAALPVNEGFDGFLRFDIRPQLTVVAGRTLTMQVHDTDKTVFHWKYSSGNTYGRGNGLFGGVPFDTNDFYFRTYRKR